MTLEAFHDISFGISKLITKKYSTSFSFGIRLFSKEFRDPIYAVYAYVRLADEIVDTFHGYDKKYLLDKFRKDTFEAIQMGISTNPVLNTFAMIVNKYKIDHSLINSFLNSMENDLYNSSYQQDEYDNYIFGSAEVVGLMCLKVFCRGDEQLYKQLLFPAQKLGSAFQKVNFLRDIRSDIDERGRIYLPGIDNVKDITNVEKRFLEKEVVEEFKAAKAGILQLPNGVKLGVYTAYLYYLILFKKIQKSDVKVLLKRRVRVSNIHKAFLFIQSYFEIKMLEIN